MSRRIGSVIGRIREEAYPYYRVDFTRHNNDWDSDDEDDSWQWNYSIRFAYIRGAVGMLFLNSDEIPYDTVERYTGRIFWADQSDTMVRMIRDTFAVRQARGEPLPKWPLSITCNAAETAWEKYEHL